MPGPDSWARPQLATGSFANNVTSSSDKAAKAVSGRKRLSVTPWMTETTDGGVAVAGLVWATAEALNVHRNVGDCVTSITLNLAFGIHLFMLSA